MVTKFCPNCGVKLPETTDMDPNRMSPEAAGEAAKSGFDTGGPFLAKNKVDNKPQKKKAGFGTFLAVALIIITVAFVIGAAMKGGIGGPVRNCIGSINGAPECSDCLDKPEPTTLNGKSVGTCTANPGTGEYDDQCTLNCP